MFFLIMKKNKTGRNIIIIVSVIVGLFVLTGMGFGIKAYVDLQKEQENLIDFFDYFLSCKNSAGML